MLNSKQDARCEAVKIAVSFKETTVDNLIEISEKIADFIIGEGTELPEVYDPNLYVKYLTQAMSQNQSKHSTFVDDLLKKIDAKPTKTEE